MRTKKHRARGYLNKHRCTICSYSTNRVHNLKAHLGSKRHWRNYLQLLLTEKEPAEGWEQELIGRKEDVTSLEEKRLTEHQLRGNLEQLRLASIGQENPWERQPVVGVDRDFWLVYTRSRWTRFSAQELFKLSNLVLMKSFIRHGVQAEERVGILAKLCIQVPKPVQLRNANALLAHFTHGASFILGN